MLSLNTAACLRSLQHLLKSSAPSSPLLFSSLHHRLQVSLHRGASNFVSSSFRPSGALPSLHLPGEDIYQRRSCHGYLHLVHMAVPTPTHLDRSRPSITAPHHFIPMCKKISSFTPSISCSLDTLLIISQIIMFLSAFSGLSGM